MKLKIATLYFGLASLFSVIELLLYGSGFLDLDPLNIVLSLGLVLNIGVAITGYAIWREVPRIGGFNDRLRVLGLIGMASILVIPVIILLDLFYIVFILLFGGGVIVVALLPHQTTQQLKIKLSFIGALLIPLLVIGSFPLFELFRQYTSLFVVEDDMVPVITIIYAIGYAIIIYGITEIRHYLAGTGFVGEETDLMYQKQKQQQ